jgi:hypothetical protein
MPAIIWQKLFAVLEDIFWHRVSSSLLSETLRLRKFRMNNTILRRLSVLALAGLAVTVIASKPVSAQSTTFAQFFQQTSSPLFVFTNTGSTSSFTSTPIPVYFNFDVANTYGTNLVAATLTITGTVSGPATVSGSPSSITQPFSNLDLTFKDASNNVLLTADATNTAVTNNPAYTGQQGGQGGAVGGSVTSTPPAVVTFTSPYISSTYLDADQNYSVTFSALNDIVAGDTTSTSDGPTVNANGYLDSFDANATGTFAAAAAPVVPEPSAALVLAIAALSLGGLVMIRRRSSSIS